MRSTRFLFFTLVLMIGLSGMSQGLIIPLLTILLSMQGVSSISNGINSSALYLGMLLASPFMEIPIRRFGYKITLVLALSLVIPSIALFPILKTLTAWFILRFTLGFGDILLHYACQLWINSISSPGRKGRNLSLYGLAYGVGFGIGPFGIYLLPFGEYTPFVTLCTLYLLALGLLSMMHNTYPEKVTPNKHHLNRYSIVVRSAAWALIPAFLAGFLEATMNNSFPIYTLKIGLAQEWVPIFLTSFTISALIMLMPIGYGGDSFGRKRLLQYGAFSGGIAFFLLPKLNYNPFLIVLILFVAGGTVGCFYSLGLAYLADIVQPNLIPVAGILVNMNYGIASMIALSINGYLLQYLSGGYIFVLLGCLYTVFALGGVVISNSRKIQER